MTVIDAFTIIGAGAAVVAAWATIGNSKASLLRRIDRKEARIRSLDKELAKKYGGKYVIQGRGFLPQTDIERRQEDLKNEIAELRKRM